MMIGESRRPLHIPPFPLLDDDLADETLSPPSYRTDHHDHPTINGMHKSPYHLQDIISALQRYLPSGLPDQASEDSERPCLGPDSPVDLYSCDDFRMYEFKVRQCARGKSHDWTECPYAHPGEKARRRDPRVFPYSGTACSDFRNGHCKKGDACEFAHGVFECWLHPTRYRTQPCKDGSKCRRRVCFFAHAPEQLRVVAAAAAAQQQSPRSMSTISADESSPPVSPVALSMSHSFGPDSLAEVIGSLRNLQLEKVKSLSPSLSMQMCGSGSGIWSPRGSNVRPGFYSLPATPTRTPTVGGIGYFDSWESSYEEEPVMERVESGRSLRAKIFEKLTEEILSDRARPE